MPSSNAFALQLPNGQFIHALGETDTLAIYHDIFEENCYRRNGITIRNGDCILDVGANTGLFVLYLNSILEQARVYAFEPVPDIYLVLRQNIREHNHLPVEAFNVGIAEKRGTADMVYYPRFSQMSTLHPDDSAGRAKNARQFIIDRIPTLSWPLRTFLRMCPRPVKFLIAETIRRYHSQRQLVKCELWHLGEFLEERRIQTVDLLKMDAEQCEQQILDSLRPGDWRKIRQVVLEVHDGPQATDHIVDVLRSQGFHTTVEPNPAIDSLSLVYGVREHPSDDSHRGRP